MPAQQIAGGKGAEGELDLRGKSLVCAAVEEERAGAVKVTLNLNPARGVSLVTIFRNIGSVEHW
jgi:hypothetical protein